MFYRVTFWISCQYCRVRLNPSVYMLHVSTLMLGLLVCLLTKPFGQRVSSCSPHTVVTSESDLDHSTKYTSEERCLDSYNSENDLSSVFSLQMCFMATRQQVTQSWESPIFCKHHSSLLSVFTMDTTSLSETLTTTKKHKKDRVLVKEADLSGFKPGQRPGLWCVSGNTVGYQQYFVLVLNISELFLWVYLISLA